MCRTIRDPEVRFRIGLSMLLLGITCFGGVDLLLDQPERPGADHVLFELGFVGLSIASMVFLWAGWLRASRALHRTRVDLEANEAERDRWRSRATKLLQGLGAEIEFQFDRWALTRAERDVALLLLKGFGHKEAAMLLERSERTVRQHAVAVYRKAGLTGRAELSAFFLEDLLLPTTTRTAKPSPGA